jgi:hypothetical protein
VIVRQPQEDSMVRVIALLAGLFLATTAFGQTAPEAENGRFVLKQVGNDMLRLDTRSGRISLCNKGSSGWSCTMVPDERTALESEIARLQNELIAARKRLAEAGDKPPVTAKRETLNIPSDDELDRVMSFMEKMWRRLIDMVQRTHKEIERRT